MSRVTGVDVTVRALRGVSASLKTATPLAEMAGYLQGKIRQQIKKQGRGRRYRAATRGQHVTRRWSRYPQQWRSSAPGSPPASPTGNLKRAVRIRYFTESGAATKNGSEAARATVGVHGSRGIGALAVLLEGRMGRPFVGPTFARERSSLERIALDRIGKKVQAAQKLLDTTGGR